MGDEPSRNVPVYEIVPTWLPIGYHLAANFAAPPLVCDRCGALIVETELHDAWHAALGR